MVSFLEVNKKGIYCRPGHFYIDPSRKVDNAVITHGHADHARRGMKKYYCTPLTKAVLRTRYFIGHDRINTFDYEEPFEINGVEVTFFPAGHILGSAQVRMTYQGETAVVTGDFKVQDDGLTKAYKPLKCDTLIMECTFGLPLYQWKTAHQSKQEVREWVMANQESEYNSVLVGYSLGKAQRLLSMLDGFGPIHVHKTIAKLNQEFIEMGIDFPEYQWLQPKNIKQLKGGIMLIPPGTIVSSFVKQIPKAKFATCSGWMQTKKRRHNNAFDAGFVISDHADWHGLLHAVKESQASHIYTTHGFDEDFARYLCEIGYNAAPLTQMLQAHS